MNRRERIVRGIGRLLRAVWALLLLILDKVVPPPPTATIRGMVTCPDVAELGGITITLVSMDGEIVQSTTTEVDGSFVMGEDMPVVTGSYSLRGHKDLPDGWLEGEMSIEVTAPETYVGALPLVRSAAARRIPAWR